MCIVKFDVHELIFSKIIVIVAAVVYTCNMFFNHYKTENRFVCAHLEKCLCDVDVNQ